MDKQQGRTRMETLFGLVLITGVVAGVLIAALVIRALLR